MDSTFFVFTFTSEPFMTVLVDWADRYWNSFHYNNKLLDIVNTESEVVSSYDDYENTRPRTAITHVWGQ